MDQRLGFVAVWWDALMHPRAAGTLIEAPPVPRFELSLGVGVIVAYAVYGCSMGITRGGFPAAISALKLPLLYTLTLAVCLPCFYVLNSIFGPGLHIRSCLRLLLLAVSANAVALLSYAPVSFFFSFTTSTATDSGYRFMLLMHVAVFAVAGALSVGIIAMIFRQAALLRRVPLRPAFFSVFALVYGIVGMQMAWVLRPWVGSWMIDYRPFRPIESSIFETLGRLITEAIAGM